MLKAAALLSFTHNFFRLSFPCEQCGLFNAGRFQANLNEGEEKHLFCCPFISKKSLDETWGSWYGATHYLKWFFSSDRITPMLPERRKCHLHHCSSPPFFYLQAKTIYINTSIIFRLTWRLLRENLRMAVVAIVAVCSPGYSNPSSSCSAEGRIKVGERDIWGGTGGGFHPLPLSSWQNHQTDAYTSSGSDDKKEK